MGIRIYTWKTAIFLHKMTVKINRGGLGGDLRAAGGGWSALQGAGHGGERLRRGWGRGGRVAGAAHAAGAVAAEGRERNWGELGHSCGVMWMKGKRAIHFFKQKYLSIYLSVCLSVCLSIYRHGVTCGSPPHSGWERS